MDSREEIAPEKALSRTSRKVSSDATAVVSPSPEITAASAHFYPGWSPPALSLYSAASSVPPQALFPLPVGGARSSYQNPYVWAPQFVQAYDTPRPFQSMFHHEGSFSHHCTPCVPPVEASDRKDLAKKESSLSENPAVDSRLGSYRDCAKSTSGSGDDDVTQSENEASSEERDSESLQPKVFSATAHKASEALSNATGSKLSGVAVDTPYSGKSASKLPVLAPGRSVAPADPANNLNVGMDLWNTSHTEVLPTKGRSTSINHSPVVHKQVMQDIQWVQDERELKKQKRKQSNRESARRSRLRKQQECEDLSKKVDQLNSENNELRSEIDQLNKDCIELESENASIMEELTRVYGRNVLAAALNGCNVVGCGLSSSMSRDSEGSFRAPP